MNSKLFLPALVLLIGTSVVSSARAEDAVQPISKSAKNTLNLKIDKRLGLLEKPWKVPKFLARTERDLTFPDRFGYRQARFLQPGPPPYFQQPEGANEARNHHSCSRRRGGRVQDHNELQHCDILFGRRIWAERTQRS